MTTVHANSVVINSISGTLKGGPFRNNTTITSVDLGGVPWTNNAMHSAFDKCYNLTTVTNINNSIVNLCNTFVQCRNLVNAPIIPNSVTDMSSTFSQCRNLVNVPVIPNSVTNTYRTFYYCSNLVNAPIIPNSVTYMLATFEGCSNLTGNIFIESNQVSYAVMCFRITTLPKNVYIPFTYSNGVNTPTYSSFISAGYKTDGSVDGVYLKDIGTL